MYQYTSSAAAVLVLLLSVLVSVLGMYEEHLNLRRPARYSRQQRQLWIVEQQLPGKNDKYPYHGVPQK